MTGVRKRALEKGHCFVAEEAFRDTIEAEKILPGRVMPCRGQFHSSASLLCKCMCDVTKCTRLIGKHRRAIGKICIFVGIINTTNCLTLHEIPRIRLRKDVDSYNY